MKRGFTAEDAESAERKRGSNACRITGDPAKYRLIDGKPVVYSVGVDRIDDGGKPASDEDRFQCARWDQKPAEAKRGDWILYPPEAEKN